jgi:nicotinate-nucleotide adenylyltransferase
MRKVGILGGSFDPIHNGHLHVAQQVREKLCLDEVILVPTGSPPHKAGERLADARHRYAMALIASHNLRDLTVSDIEVRRRGVSYTIDTVRRLKENAGDTQFYLILGSDAVIELHTWHKAEELIKEVQPVVVARPGCSVDEAITGLEGKLSGSAIDKLLQGVLEIDPVKISSTEIRKRLAAGQHVKGMVRHEVEEYIRQHGLYGTHKAKSR